MINSFGNVLEDMVSIELSVFGCRTTGGVLIALSVIISCLFWFFNNRK